MKTFLGTSAIVLLAFTTGFSSGPASVPSAWQQQVDAQMTKAANDPNAAPEIRANVAASQAQFDALCRVDARLGTREAHIFFDQEVARQKRILVAMQHLSR